MEKRDARSKKPRAEKRAGKIPDEFRGFFSELKNLKQRAFLAGYVRSKHTVTAAARLSGVSRYRHYEWMRNDPLYREHFEQARMILADMVEEEVYRRAYEGYDTPVIYRGEITDWYKSYSDALAMFMLRKLRPEVYRDNAGLPFEGPTMINITAKRAGSDPDAPPERISYPLLGPSTQLGAGAATELGTGDPPRSSE